MSFIIYIFCSLINAGFILLLGIVPWLLMAWCLNYVSELLQRRLAFLGDRAFIYLTAPGVAVHELGHAAFCLIFRHKIVKMNLFSLEADGTLGYVEHQYDPKSLYQRIGNFFIGTGPIWGGLLLLYVLSRLLLPGEIFSSEKSVFNSFFSFFKLFFSLESWTSVFFYIWLYATLTVSSHITLSQPDIKGAKDGLIILTEVIVLACLLFGWCGPWEECLIHQLTLVFFLLFPLVVTIASALLIIASILSLLPFARR